MKKSTLKKILLLSILSFVFIGVSRAEAATLYAKTAGGNWSAAGTWSNTGSGGGDSSGPPTAADNVIFETGSGNVTIDATAVARSIDTTSGTGNYAGVLTHDAAITLSIGDGTLGTGNVALKLNSGMTYTKGSVTTSDLRFVSTVTGNTITMGGKTSGDILFSGVGGSWILQDPMNTSFGGTGVTLTSGHLDTNGQNCSWDFLNSTGTATRVLTITNSTITMTRGPTGWTVNATGMTLNASGSTIQQAISSGFSFNAGTGLTYGNLISTGAATFTITGASTFANITKTGTAAKTDIFSLATDITVTGTLTINGNSSVNRVLVQSNVLGTARTITFNGATNPNTTITNADFRDITAAGSFGAWDLSAITGLSGDAQGNTNITFTTAATQYWVGNAGSWSTAGEWGTTSGGSGGRTPLPQDDVVFDANSINAGSLTVQIDMPRYGKTLTTTGVLNSPIINNQTTLTGYGGLILSGLSASSLGTGFNWTLEGRGNFDISSSGTVITGSASLILSAVGGTYTLLDDMNLGSRSLLLTNGTFNAAGYNVTANTFNTGSYVTTRTLTMGSGTWTITGSGASMWTTFVTGLTLNANSSTIVSTSTAAKTFVGGGQTYNNLTLSGAGTADITFSGNNTFNEFKDIGSAAHSILFTAASTQTITTFTVSGTSGAVITLNSTTTGTYALVKANGGVVSSDYLNIQHSVATPSSTWYAGANSTDNQATATAGSGWIFTVPPAVAKMSVKIKGLIKIFGGVKFR